MKTLLPLLPLLFIPLLCSTYASAEAKQPNIVILFADDLEKGSGREIYHWFLALPHFLRHEYPHAPSS